MAAINNIKQEYDEILQLVSFFLEKEEYGVDILKVREINKMMQLTKVPNAPQYVEGVINLRGKIIPVVDLRTKLGMPRREPDTHSRIIVVDVEDKTLGFIVDRVSEVLRIPVSVTEPPPAIVSGVDTEYITSVGKLDDRLLILLDLNKVFNDEEKEKIDALN
ncbi:MAG TPA: chemotaxis protein CheW [Melioribacteraceae bacterium]|nr:chemotaxis protein CheW [Melioribacteraceae bacterium]